MKIDRARAQRAFADYAAHYNTADPKVKLKIDHTYRVAALCGRIAESLSLPQQDIDLAWLSGILHDVAALNSCAGTTPLLMRSRSAMLR